MGSFYIYIWPKYLIIFDFKLNIKKTIKAYKTINNSETKVYIIL